MNRIRSSKFILIFSLLWLLIPAVIQAKLQKPVSGGDQKEILVINDKRRLYYNLTDQGMIYSLTGPNRVEIISRYSSPRKSRKALSYDFIMVLDKVDTINVHHRYLISKSIRSAQHSNAYFTHSGNDFLNLDSGRHQIEFLPVAGQKRPTLIRVITSEFSREYRDKNWLIPTTSPAPFTITTESSHLDYYEASHEIPLQLSIKGERMLKIISRLEFEPWMGTEEPYRIRIREGKTIVGTYFFSTERSTKAVADLLPDIVPAKWRTCEVKVPEGNHTYEITVMEKDRKVLLRFMEYK
ncbi:MAG: hypothetical protein GXO90_04155 [FCB group bacterium]|nr:hypothetical protein [FCB group bacterium]